MKNRNGRVNFYTIIVIISLIIVMVACFNVYKENDFNGFEKAISENIQEENYKNTKFSRDSKVKYSKDSSYKIENLEYSDAMIYKEIEVEPNTPYKISCMVKTENVNCDITTETGGATIGILETTEYSKPITGTNDWQLLEFMFNSKDRQKVKISFRLGGNQTNCSGTVWFSDFKLEKGKRSTREEWNIGCFIIRNLNVEIDGKQYDLKTNSADVENARLNMSRFKDDCYNFSNKKMTVNYDIIEITEPINTISYSEEHGYYISYKDVEDAIYETVREKEYDHIFVVCRMEDDAGENTIPIYDNWIGLGSMDMYGIRIFTNKNK